MIRRSPTVDNGRRRAYTKWAVFGIRSPPVGGPSDPEL